MEFLEVPLIIFLAVVLPIAIIFHYATEMKKAKGLSAQDEATLDELRRLSEKLEDRTTTLERILDDEVPDWRSRRHETL
ncbi:phage shock protein B [Iodidimonas gelatinilytica]|uniref:Phage shock protein B n=2 Tax=Iodidimonas TaxID=2066486 RepID=A0A5A7MPW0_9PROT|nr:MULTISPECIES: envelope stress response membrane protein PspB [Iodidimonas]GEQ97233.1 phage shock protein B [Iodidimonas gelatinilytica]GEQ99564.1 phage shock protein B [Iodidimonas gelatinilytica]GER07333.1 phage shock protein B [Kordiimonadales bacterium JCM 17843]GGO10940.1 phage shock protein B [Iodidimonas muriae]